MDNSWLWSKAVRFAFGVSSDEADFTRRGFQCDDCRARAHFERIGRTAIDSFNWALGEPRPEHLASDLATIDPELWGYAFEGAAMALTVLDFLTPWPSDRLKRFWEGPGAAHIEIVNVGIGFALARLRRNVERALPQFDPLFGWLAVDGYGFHEGYYHWPRYEGGRASMCALSPFGLRVFDQGLGRSLWFTRCAKVESIASAIAGFPPQRSADLWTGIGVACAYAGGVERLVLEALREAVGPFQTQLAEGACFAAKARQRGGNPAAHTATACEVFCSLSANEAAQVADQALAHVPEDGPEPAYAAWHRLVQARFVPAELPMVRQIS